MSEVARNYRRVMERVHMAASQSRRDPSSIRLVAVTKTVSIDRIRELVACGVTDLGESRLQEAIPKQDALRDLPVNWHFIGHLQTNKARRVAERFHWIHSVDRADLAEKLNAVAPSRLRIFIEVQLAAEATKSGVQESGLGDLISAVRACDRLELCGLMAVPPFTEDPHAARPYFRRLRELAERHGLAELSMGMSHDFEVAIEEGATMIRVGTALFGERT